MSKIKNYREILEEEIEKIIKEAIGKNPEVNIDGFSLCTVCDNDSFSSLEYHVFSCRKCRTKTTIDNEGLITKIE
jgi:ribosomal protein L37AE/L43A